MEVRQSEEDPSLESAKDETERSEEIEELAILHPTESDEEQEAAYTWHSAESEALRGITDM